MTRSESLLKSANEKIANGELNSYESDFIEKIKDYTKKDLKKLSYKQFKLLEKIVNN